MKPGTTYHGNGGCEFTVWAPRPESVSLQLLDPTAADPRSIPMQQQDHSYWTVHVADVAPGTRYLYELHYGDHTILRPDPASHSQPEGVHQASQVVDHQSFNWQDHSWSGIALTDMVIYELHVGTFTPAGTFEAIIPRLSTLLDLGINTLEIMPVAQFPGQRNWGYDGTYPYAVQNSYGGPDGLKQLVNACHQVGIAVILDVVYNHLGPEGNYTHDFGPYFTDHYHTPWGNAINFDGPNSDQVRCFFIENALFWLREYHMDGLRLDAIHAIYDFGAKHVLAEMGEAVADFATAQGRACPLIAESDLNDARVIRPRDRGGYGMEAQWSDDFHHALHTLLTKDRSGYYEDYGKIEDLAKVMQQGFAYTWDYSAYRQRHHGNDPSDRPTDQFVVCIQNHDQVGNRLLGERLSQLTSLEGLKLAAVTVLLSPYVPLLFMGEEYGEEAPFQYFIDHGDPDLIEAVRAGRKREFATFYGSGEPPDAASLETFQRSILNWDLQTQTSSSNSSNSKHSMLWSFYQHLLQLRTQIPALKQRDRQAMEITTIESSQILILRRWQGENQAFLVLNFADQPTQFIPSLPALSWKNCLDSADPKWLGPGSLAPPNLDVGIKIPLQPQHAVLYVTP